MEMTDQLKGDNVLFKGCSRVVAVVALAGASLLVPAPKVSATPFGVHIRSQQYNAAMVAKGPGSKGVIAMHMHDHSPHTVSLNEICFKDVIDVKNNTGYAQPALYEAAIRPECDLYQGRRSFGNAAFVVGAAPMSGYEREFNGQHVNDLTKDHPERRGMACAWAQTYVGRLVSCSAHLTNQSASSASSQAGEYAFLWATTAGTSGVSLSVLGGDFNFTPSSGHMPTYINSNFERIVSLYTHSTPSPTRTIDYMLVKNPNYTGQVQTPGTNRWCDSTHSDHCYIWGTFF
jgi:endonuclease/exonuclease/phosphatase family metal-dependent hydrolase